MARGLDHRDMNGRIPQVGEVVRYGDREGRVLIVEGPIPGSESTAAGLGTLLVEGLGEYGDNRVVRAAEIEVVRERFEVRELGVSWCIWDALFETWFDNQAEVTTFSNRSEAEEMCRQIRAGFEASGLRVTL